MKNLLNNYGFYIMTGIMIFQIITFFIFIFQDYHNIKKDINKIYTSVKGNESNKIKSKQSVNNPIKKEKTKKSNKHKHHKNKKSFINENNEINFDNIEKKIESKNRRKSHNKYSREIAQNVEEKTTNKIKFGKLEINILKQNDFELNALDYEDALKIDHRSFIEYYISLLRYNHPLMFAFAPNKDYNSRIIKMFLFFFSFSLDLTINALFFTDDTMNKIYVDRGKYDFLYQLPQIIYSEMISRVIDILIKHLSLSQDAIVELKQANKKDLNKKYIKQLIKSLKIKFIFFFIISFIILLLFSCYIISFCGIYVNTQICLIKDSVTSLGSSFLLPFGTLLIPGIIRIFSLKKRKKNKNKSYKAFLFKIGAFIENYIA